VVNSKSENQTSTNRYVPLERDNVVLQRTRRFRHRIRPAGFFVLFEGARKNRTLLTGKPSLARSAGNDAEDSGVHRAMPPAADGVSKIIFAK
jgi:hypothetical protein